ncbi:MAG: GHKL domain-containing protein [Bacilli bacterium]|nr:GHKL domain-containing protein [Bacilli bacterium]
MWEVINLILISIIQIMICNYINKKQTQKQIDYKNSKKIIIEIIMIILIFLLNYYINTGIKPLLIYGILVFGYKKIIDITFKESVIINFISIIIHGIAELLELFIFVIILKIPEDILVKYFQSKPITSILIFIIIWIIFKIGNKVIIKIKKILENEKILNTFYILGLLGISILFSKNLNNLNQDKDFIINIITIVIFLGIIIFLIKEKIDKHNVYKEYDNLFKYLENTESLLEKYQKYNHENKNQLIYIKNLVPENKEITDFVDSILEDENKIHKNRWIKELKNVPSGGLKGFLSYKINYMIDKGINVNINVSPKVKKFKFKNKQDNFQKNICRILGVYLDNAYQASKKTQKKEVTIEMLIENEKLLIIISNSYKGKIKIEEMDKIGYTTKGKGHGFGLSLVNDIINSDKSITQERKIINNFFYQYLFIEN